MQAIIQLADDGQDLSWLRVDQFGAILDISFCAWPMRQTWLGRTLDIAQTVIAGVPVFALSAANRELAGQELRYPILRIQPYTLEDWHRDVVYAAHKRGLVHLISTHPEDHRAGYEDGGSPDDEVSEQVGAAEADCDLSDAAAAAGGVA